MAKIHPIRNSELVKAIRDMHSLFKEESLKIKKIIKQYYSTQGYWSDNAVTSSVPEKVAFLIKRVLHLKLIYCMSW
jgi:hypothetical protein